MDPIREGIAQVADKLSFALQNAFQTFGFLPDGRELVEMSEMDAGVTVTFSDRSEEGWPGFSMNIPPAASFSHATIGFLARRAHWTLAMAPKAIVDHLCSQNDGFPAPGRRSGRGWCFRLDQNVEVAVVSNEKGVSLLAVRQIRDPDSLEAAVRARCESYTEQRRESQG